MEIRIATITQGQQIGISFSRMVACDIHKGIIAFAIVRWLAIPWRNIVTALIGTHNTELSALQSELISLQLPLLHCPGLPFTAIPIREGISNVGWELNS